MSIGKNKMAVEHETCKKPTYIYIYIYIYNIILYQIYIKYFNSMKKNCLG